MCLPAVPGCYLQGGLACVGMDCDIRIWVAAPIGIHGRVDLCLGQGPMLSSHSDTCGQVGWRSGILINILWEDSNTIGKLAGFIQC